jgi:hypothetical protein
MIIVIGSIEAHAHVIYLINYLWGTVSPPQQAN